MIILKLFISGEYETQWLSRVKDIPDNCGLSYIWLNQNFIDKSHCKSIIHKWIVDIAHQKWYIASLIHLCALRINCLRHSCTLKNIF